MVIRRSSFSIPLTSAKIFTLGRSHANPDAVHSILVKAESAASMSEAEPLIARILKGNAINSQSANVTISRFRTSSKSFRSSRERFTVNSPCSYPCWLELLVVGGIGVTNVMLVTVAERIDPKSGLAGCRRVSGDIRKQFLLEASLLARLAGCSD